MGTGYELPDTERRELTVGDIFEAAGASGFVGRLQEILKSPRAREALEACARIPINLAIGFADMTPLVGETTGIANLGLKVGRHFLKFLNKIDPTPDIGLGRTAVIEAGAFIPELATFGGLPSHLVNGLAQAMIDKQKGRFEDAGDVLQYLFTGNPESAGRLKEKQVLLDAAADVFLKGN